MKPAYLIWDWNGTLLDDTWLCYDIANAMLAERGMTPLAGHDGYRDIFCFPIIDYYRRMGYAFDADSEPYEVLSDQYVNSFEKSVHLCKLRPGTKEVLKAVKKSGLPQALLSATGLWRLVRLVESHKLESCFTHILGLPNDFAYSKVAMAKDFLEREELSPSDVLFIGDTDHDFAVAQACGCRCVLINGGHQHRAALEACGVPVFDTLAELGRYLELI